MSDERLFLVSGTNAEREHIARERGIDPRSIRLVQSLRDILGHRGGRIVFGHTGSSKDYVDIVHYAKTHGIVINRGYTLVHACTNTQRRVRSPLDR